jgi:hypothetical protein
MKRLMMAGVLALALVAASQQTASAGCCFSMGGSFHINYTGSGCCFSCNFNSMAPCCGPGGFGGGYGGGYGGGFAGSPPVFGGYGYDGYAYAPPAAHPAPQAPAPAAQSTAQQVGYYPQTGYGYGYGTGYGYGYGYGQAPGYWYGN